MCRAPASSYLVGEGAGIRTLNLGLKRDLTSRLGDSGLLANYLVRTARFRPAVPWSQSPGSQVTSGGRAVILVQGDATLFKNDRYTGLGESRTASRSSSREGAPRSALSFVFLRYSSRPDDAAEQYRVGFDSLSSCPSSTRRSSHCLAWTFETLSSAAISRSVFGGSTRASSALTVAKSASAGGGNRSSAATDAVTFSPITSPCVPASWDEFPFTGSPNCETDALGRAVLAARICINSSNVFGSGQRRAPLRPNASSPRSALSLTRTYTGT